MLHVFRSNLVETLLDLLARRLQEAPLASPLVPELVVTPSPAMARWVNLGLAQRLGIAANLTYPLPASFVWGLASELLRPPGGMDPGMEEGDPLALEPMAWRIFGALPGLIGEPAFAPLRSYLGTAFLGTVGTAGEPPISQASAMGLRGASAAIKRWQLAGRIADTFDRYQLYRPDLIRAWSGSGSSETAPPIAAANAWQPILWRHLCAGAPRHRVAVIDQLLGRLAGVTPRLALPERLTLFAVSSLPPLLVEVIQALAGHTRVDLYLHSPTDQFWADLVNERVQARRRLEHPDQAELWEVGNPLLASWGRQGQALQDLLLNRETPQLEADAWAEPARDSLLHRLQHDIFHLTGAEAGREVLVPDSSLLVQVCHSPLRECQSLHDWLLDLFEADPGLNPEDCLVMIPEIDTYAPYVEAVFERDPSGARPPIPWNLSDLSLRDEHPLIRVFLQLLDLPNSRFGHAEILSYPEVPELAQTFGLDAEAVTQIRDWLAQARLRWGLDAAHKARLGLPATNENTWAQIEQRLFGGYALADDDPGDDSDPSFSGIVPITGVEGTGAQTLGRFWHLLNTLRESAAALARPRPAADWQADLTALLTTYFAAGDDEAGRIQRIRDALAELATQAAAMDAPPPDPGPAQTGSAGSGSGAVQTLPLSLIRHWLGERLGSASRRGRYFRGGVTFCGMRPMRSLPFAVIAVLGLNDGVFPRVDRPAEFDLMRRDWRPGDPRKGDEDRYLFLETLLCARRRLYLSYVGRDLRGNAERQPSVLLRELLDAVDRRYQLAPGPDGTEAPPLSRAITRVAPMQPFSPRNYDGGQGGGGGPSFDLGWCDLARAGLAAATPGVVDPRAGVWPDQCLPPAPEALHQVGLTQLERWLRHPIRYFVNTRLQVYLRESEPEPDDEPFALDALQQFSLKQRLVQGRRRRLGADAAMPRVPSLRALAARGELPHGAFAGLTYGDALTEVSPLLDALDAYQGLAPVQIAIDLRLADPEDPIQAPGPTRLVGQVPDLYPGLGLLRVRPAKLKGVDILALWLHHLAWCAMYPEPQGGERRSRILCLDQSFTLDADLDQKTARAELTELLALYWEGLHRPLPILPRASHAFARAMAEDRDPAGAVNTIWVGNRFQGGPGECEDPYVQLILRGRELDLMALPEFADLAQALYATALAYQTTDTPEVA